MSLLHLLKALGVVNTLTTIVAVFALLRLRTQQYSAMKLYLWANAVGGALMDILLNLRIMSPDSRYMAYFWIYVATYMAGTAAVFFVIEQIFHDALSPLAGLRRLGLVIFRWIAITSVVLVASSAIPMGLHYETLSVAMWQMVRCVSIMEICLLAFLAVSVHSLGFSFGSRIFGIGLGFGVSACSDFVVSAVLQHRAQMVSYTNLVGEIGTWMGLIIWSVYFFKPEPARQPVTLPVTSPLLRWNEIANALGHKGGQVVIAQPAFFLQDVEKVVDRVLTKNALNEPRAS